MSAEESEKWRNLSGQAPAVSKERLKAHALPWQLYLVYLSDSVNGDSEDRGIIIQTDLIVFSLFNIFFN